MISTACLYIIDRNFQDQNLSNYFTQFGYRIIHFHDFKQIDRYQEKPSAMLINWQVLQNTNTDLQTIFEHFHTPLIVISDSPNEEMSIKMLENGADDFLVKPINFRELHARITAINRRIQKSFKVEDEKEELVFNNWHLYPASRQLFNDNNEEIKLSTSEYNLLLAFLREPQQILSREYLLQLTKHSDLKPYDRRIDIQISRLRQKIESAKNKTSLIKTIRNGGYLFTAEVYPMKKQ
jgi:two-component system OmpR family response regulator